MAPKRANRSKRLEKIGDCDARHSCQHSGRTTAGCDDFIRKPFRNAAIFERISNHVGVRFVYEEPRQSADLPRIGVEIVMAKP